MAGFNYDDPIIYELRSGTSGDAYQVYTDVPYKVVNSEILINELPVRLNHVQIKDTSTTPATNYFEIQSGTPGTLEFYVDYLVGIIKLNSAAAGKTLAVSFSGRGSAVTPHSRVYTKSSGGAVTQTLKDVLDNYVFLPTGTTSITYNTDGTINQITLPTGTVTLTYTSGKVTQVVETILGNTQTATISYNSDGTINTVTIS